MNAVQYALSLARNNNIFAFGVGICAGAGFELFKIYFSFNGVSYYTVFKKKQLEKELTKYELTLKDLDNLIAKSPNIAFNAETKVGS
uniref:Uncharacterized protein n=1 Tax=Panagrolaimus sp. JU765 TaxID=591449 RepID=A0AC34QK91_9BILA